MIVTVLLFNVTTPTVSGVGELPVINVASAPDCQVTLPVMMPVPSNVPPLPTITAPVPVPEPDVLITFNVAPLVINVLPV